MRQAQRTGGVLDKSAVNRQWSVAIRSHDRVRWIGDRNSIAGKVVHYWLEFFHVGGSEQIPFECASEEMLRFVQRTPRNFHETPVVLKIVAAGSFSDVRDNAVSAPDNLPADSVFGKGIPSNHDCPNHIGQFL